MKSVWLPAFLAWIILHSLGTEAEDSDVNCGQPDSKLKIVVPIPNLCKNTPGKPFCVNIASEKQPKYVCRECEVNCDCPIGFYCLKAAGVKRGYCQQIDPDQAIWNKPCNQFSSGIEYITQRPNYPIKGFDDVLLCGVAVYNQSSAFQFYEWLGYCKQGKCKYCATWGPNMQETLDFAIGKEPHSMLCPGRVCVGGQLEMAKCAKEQQNPIVNIFVDMELVKGLKGSILAFVVLIFLCNVVMCLVQVRSAKKAAVKRKKKSIQPHS